MSPADDVLGMLRKHFGDEMFVDETKFLQTLEKDKIARVPGNGGVVVAPMDSSLSHGDKSVDVFRSFRLSQIDVYPWHARFEALILFFIVGASTVDSVDDN